MISIALIFPLAAFSQSRLTFQKADSISYAYFIKGDWPKLIDVTQRAFDQKIDSKFMRQRAGYAYFMSGDYFSARTQYEKALTFDLSDATSLEYIYYSSLYSGAPDTRYHAGKLPAEAKKRLGIEKFIPVESVDGEYNVKTNRVTTRTDQEYYRVGINTELGYRLSLYQAYSFYEQTANSIDTRQPEYLAILKYSMAPVWQLKAAYHHLFTRAGTLDLPANLGHAAISRQISRLNLEAGASLLQSVVDSAGTKSMTKQASLQANVALPGKSNLYFTGALVGMNEYAVSRLIYSQSAGLRLYRNLWAEGNVTLGRLKNYTTYNGLYVFNSLDPSVFRTGITLAWFAGKHLSVNCNFTFDQQEMTTSSTTIINKVRTTSSTVSNYNQFSYSGGIKWKL